MRSGKGAVVYLPDRSYLMKAAYSKGPWFGENEMFGDDAIYKELFMRYALLALAFLLLELLIRLFIRRLP